MQRPIFKRSTRFNVIGWQTPVSRLTSGLIVTFRPANRAAWVLCGMLAAFVALAFWGGPMAFGPELLFGVNTVQTRWFLAVLALFLSCVVVLVFSESDDA